MADTLTLRGKITIKLFSESGELILSRTHNNLITTVGKGQLLLASSPKALKDFSYMGIGTSSTAAAIGDTALGAEVARSTSITATNPDAASLQFLYLFGGGVGTGSIKECGLLSATSGGVLLSRVVFSPIVKGVTDSMAITYTLSFN